MHTTLDSLFVVGAGGIGCAAGYALRAAGSLVTFVDADPDKVRWGQSHGVRVDHLPPQRADFIAFADWTPPPRATVLLCTKCYDNAAVLARLPRAHDKRVLLIPIQNGFDRSLEEAVESEGIASFVSECVPHQSHTRMTRRGSLHLGFRGACLVSADARERLAELAALLRRRRLFRVRSVTDILPFKYTKLMYNAAIGPLAAAAGLDNGQLLSIAPARRLFFTLLRENYNILDGAGIGLARIGPLHPLTVQCILRRPAISNLAALFFYPSLRGSYCSMAGDVPRGRTEIEFYNRHLIDLASQHDLRCPLNTRVFDLIKTMESNRATPGLHWLKRL